MLLIMLLVLVEPFKTIGVPICTASYIQLCLVIANMLCYMLY